MSQFSDWLLRYGILMGKRYSDKERRKFLRSIQLEFEQMNYQVDVTSADLSFAGAKKQFYNLYAGDLENAQVVIATYYDTPVKTTAFTKEKAFNSSISHLDMFLNFLPSLLILTFTTYSVYFGFLPLLNNGGSSIWWFPTIALVLVALFLITRYRSGIPRRSNLVRNSSSLLALLMLANKLDSHEKLAFAFVDGGTNSGYGMKMAQDYFKEKSRFIVLDSVSNQGDPLCFTDQKLKMSEFSSYKLPPAWSEIGDVLVTAGEFKNDQVILRKSKEMDESKIQRVVNGLEELLKQLLGKAKN